MPNKRWFKDCKRDTVLKVIPFISLFIVAFISDTNPLIDYTIIVAITMSAILLQMSVSGFKVRYCLRLTPLYYLLIILFLVYPSPVYYALIPMLLFSVYIFIPVNSKLIIGTLYLIALFCLYLLIKDLPQFNIVKYFPGVEVYGSKYLLGSFSAKIGFICSGFLFSIIYIPTFFLLRKSYFIIPYTLLLYFLNQFRIYLIMLMGNLNQEIALGLFHSGIGLIMFVLFTYLTLRRSLYPLKID